MPENNNHMATVIFIKKYNANFVFAFPGFLERYTILSEKRIKIVVYWHF